GLSRQQHRQPCRLLTDQSELQLPECRLFAAPVVVYSLEADGQTRLPPGIAIGAGSGRPLVKPVDSFLVPLRLADDPEIPGARATVIHDGRRLLDTEHD